MIQVNLLPEDLKKSAQISSANRSVVWGAALLVVAAIGVAYFHVAHVLPRERLNRQLTERLALLKKESQELVALETAAKHIEKRKRALEDLYARRVLWSQKLDQLVDIVPPNIWWDSVKLSAPRRTRSGAASGGTLSFECFSAGEEEKGITLFRDRLKAHEAFWKDVEKPNRISHTRREFPAYVEGVALEFNLDLDLKARKAAAPDEPAGRSRTAAGRTARAN